MRLRNLRSCQIGFDRRWVTCVLAAAIVGGACDPALDAIVRADDTSGYFTDPDTGVVYRKVVRTIDRPVVETQMQSLETTIYRPEVVVDSRPETRTVYAPVVSYGWEPRLRNGWNPFAQPTVVYEHVPRTHWEARSETYDRRETRTNWIPEKQRTEVPRQIVRIQREEKVDLEPVGRVAPQQAQPPASTESAIAARLRPIDPNTRISPYATASAMPGGTSEIGAARRNSLQSGIRANDLYPSSPGGYSMPLPPATLPVAGLPFAPLWR